jgi:hypothetical protein
VIGGLFERSPTPSLNPPNPRDANRQELALEDAMAPAKNMPAGSVEYFPI